MKCPDLVMFSIVICCFAASMLEVGRLIVDSGWVPMKPIIFLFNGAEELFMVVSILGLFQNLVIWQIYRISTKNLNNASTCGIFEKIVVWQSYFVKWTIWCNCSLIKQLKYLILFFTNVFMASIMHHIIGVAWLHENT